MGLLVLYVLIADNCKEYYLGESLDGIVPIKISFTETKDYSDYTLYAENINGQWYLKTMGDLRFIDEESELTEKLLNPTDFISVGLPDIDAEIQIFVDCYETNIISLRKYDLSEVNKISIGSSSDDTIEYNSRYLLPNNIEINTDGGFTSINCREDHSYIYLNGKRIQSSTLSFGDVINILGLKVVFLNSIIAINTPTNLSKINLSELAEDVFMQRDSSYRKEDSTLDGQMYFQRSPRIINRLEETEEEIDAPPPPIANKEQPLLLAIGPALTMGMGMLFSMMFTIYSSKNNPQIIIPGIVVTVTMLAGTILWPIFSRMYHKLSTRKEEKRRLKRYRGYIQKEYKKLEEKIEKNRLALSKTYTEPTVCINRAINKDRRLWERMPTNKDFLEVRLGKGTRVSTVSVKIPRERFTMVDDPLMDELKDISNDFKLIHDVPIAISLFENNMLGVIGEPVMILEEAKSIIVQLSALHSYDEVKIVCIYNSKESREWEWVKRLPHVWGPEKSIRFAASTRDEVREVFLYLYEVLTEREESKKDYTQQKVIDIPHFLVFIADPELVENELVMRYLTSSSTKLGVTTVFLYEKINLLPKECKSFIQLSDTECSLYHRDDLEGELIIFKPDTLYGQDLNSFSRALAAIKVKEIATSLSLPSTLTFLEMYRVGRIEHLDIRRRWRDNLAYRSLEAPLGVKAGDTLFYLNIHEKYHGPHGLIAGMTGSGKSEFIQSYILSMAVNYHPHDVSFILIDYKGGGMANCFEGLPHVSGTITNLGGNQINRSLVSLESELKRRQRIFAEYGVNHIDKYQQLYKEQKAKDPLPHLIIISDEFAELKTQQPEFMEELVSAARIGRSLGIHLILATQKPSGVVDDQIWSNTRFRICLKVLDKSDSNEMLKRPEAANIIEPGRCYVQVGNDEIFDLIQSGWSGANYIPTDKIEKDEHKQLHLIDNCGRILKTASCKVKTIKSDSTQLSAIVEYISQIADKEEIKPTKLWLEPLRKIVFIEDVVKSEGGWNGTEWEKTQHWMCPVIGIVDDPRRQSQYPLTADIGNEGHMLLYGAPGTGKTTFLQTLIYSLVTSYSPEVVNVYIADFGGRTLGYFKDLPHVGGIVFSDDEEKLDKLLKLITKELANRKKLFSEYGVGSLKSYMEASEEKLPAMVIVLDNYEAFNELYPDYESVLITLSREGGNYGIYLVLAANSANSIKYRITQNFKLLFTLQLNDKYDYVSVVGQTNNLEPEAVPGRGLVKMGSVLEYQTAVVCRTENEADRVSQLRILFKEMKMKWHGIKAKPIPSVPEELTFDEMMLSEEGQELIGQGLLPLGYDVDEANIISLDFRDAFTYAILGPEKTGKTNLLKAIMKFSIDYLGYNTYTVDSKRGELYRFSLKHGKNECICDAKEFNDFIDRALEEMKIRHKDLKEFKETAVNSVSEHEYMSKYERIIVLIDDFDCFFDMISDRALNLMEGIVREAEGLRVHFVFTGNPNKISKYCGSALYNHIFSGTKGILLGGRLESQEIFSPNMNYQQRSATLDSGVGYMINKSDYRIIKTPLV